MKSMPFSFLALLHFLVYSLLIQIDAVLCMFVYLFVYLYVWVYDDDVQPDGNIIKSLYIRFKTFICFRFCVFYRVNMQRIYNTLLVFFYLQTWKKIIVSELLLFILTSINLLNLWMRLFSYIKWQNLAPLFVIIIFFFVSFNEQLKQVKKNIVPNSVSKWTQFYCISRKTFCFVFF